MFTKIFSKNKPPKPEDTLDFNALAQGLEDVKKREKQAVEVLDFLDIPCQYSGSPFPSVPATELVKILTDEKKMKVIMSKIRNKAFW